MNKDIVCQVPALVGPGKTPVQDSAGAWLPWALLPASAAAELSQWLGGRPGAGGLGSVGATLAGPEGRRLGSQTDLRGACTSGFLSPQAPTGCPFQPHRALENTVPVHRFMGLLTQQTSRKL